MVVWKTNALSIFEYLFYYYVFVANFNQSSNLAAEDEQSQLQNEPSSMYTLWNLIADLIESNDQKHDQQQQITDSYVKTTTIFHIS